MMTNRAASAVVAALASFSGPTLAQPKVVPTFAVTLTVAEKLSIPPEDQKQLVDAITQELVATKKLRAASESAVTGASYQVGITVTTAQTQAGTSAGFSYLAMFLGGDIRFAATGEEQPKATRSVQIREIGSPKEPEKVYPKLVKKFAKEVTKVVKDSLR